MNSHALSSPEPRRSGWRKLAGWVAGLFCATILLSALPVAGAAEPAAKAKVSETGHAGHAEAKAPSGHHDDQGQPPSWLKQFAFSYLTAYMFFLSLPLGALFLVMLHHLLDASWSVPTRRFLEHIACLSFPWMALLFIPIAIFAKDIFPWMCIADPHADHALNAKLPLFTPAMFYVVSAFCFAIWGWLSHSLRRWSLEQDRTGAAGCTFKMRSLTYWGIFAFAITLTLATILWMKALQHEWFSTMYPVQYFAASVWTTLATAYLLACHFKRTGPLRDVLQEKQFYYLGSLLFAFTVFYSYVTFSQYFIIWNANMPEETFFFVAREMGSWEYVGYLIIFGHFFAPFLALLRIDFKLKIEVMFPVCVWAWLMHYFDMQYNIMPTLYPHGIHLGVLDPICLIVIGTVLYKAFFKSFAAHPPFPQKDPRFAEAMDIYVEPASHHTSTHGGVK
jgi:hypothetical protein